MALTEDRILRYSRQILLREVGGVGQQRLLATAVHLHGQGAALTTAAAYLAGGGCRVVAGEGPVLPGAASFVAAGEPFAGALAELNPDAALGAEAADRRIALVALPAVVPGDGAATVLGGQGGHGAVLWRAQDACADCFALALAPLGAAPPGALAAWLGSVAALAVVRLALGLALASGGVRLGADGDLSPLELPSCPRCR